MGDRVSGQHVLIATHEDRRHRELVDEFCDRGRHMPGVWLAVWTGAGQEIQSGRHSLGGNRIRIGRAQRQGLYRSQRRRRLTLGGRCGRRLVIGGVHSVAGHLSPHLSVSREGTGCRLAVGEVAVPTSVAAGVGPKLPRRVRGVIPSRSPFVGVTTPTLGRGLCPDLSLT